MAEEAAKVNPTQQHDAKLLSRLNRFLCLCRALSRERNAFVHGAYAAIDGEYGAVYVRMFKEKNQPEETGRITSERCHKFSKQLRRAATRAGNWCLELA
jgi:hypothetical protein